MTEAKRKAKKAKAERARRARKKAEQAAATAAAAKAAAANIVPPPADLRQTSKPIPSVKVQIEVSHNRRPLNATERDALDAALIKRCEDERELMHAALAVEDLRDQLNAATKRLKDAEAAFIASDERAGSLFSRLPKP